MLWEDDLQAGFCLTKGKVSVERFTGLPNELQVYF